jgi:hypothetical protein
LFAGLRCFESGRISAKKFYHRLVSIQPDDDYDECCCHNKRSDHNPI